MQVTTVSCTLAVFDPSAEFFPTMNTHEKLIESTPCSVPALGRKGGGGTSNVWLRKVASDYFIICSF